MASEMRKLRDSVSNTQSGAVVVIIRSRQLDFQRSEALVFFPNREIRKCLPLVRQAKMVADFAFAVPDASHANYATGNRTISGLRRTTQNKSSTLLVGGLESVSFKAASNRSVIGPDIRVQPYIRDEHFHGLGITFVKVFSVAVKRGHCKH
jgi:hypothetical protein